MFFDRIQLGLINPSCILFLTLVGWGSPRLKSDGTYARQQRIGVSSVGTFLRRELLV